MGRGQAVIKDSFTAVIGERRGIGKEQEDAIALQEYKELATTAFSENLETRQRMLALVQWMMLRQTTGNEFWPRNSALTSRIYEGTEKEKEKIGLCQLDFDNLLIQGICSKKENNTYSLTSHSSWSRKHQDVMQAWMMAGSPGPSRDYHIS